MIAQFVLMLLTFLVSNGNCIQNGYNGPNAPGGLFVYTCVVSPPAPPAPRATVLPPRVELRT